MKTSTINKNTLVAFTSVLVILSSDIASAGVIEETIVTARKRDESLQDVPVVVSAYNAEQISRLGITGVDDLLELTPSMVGYSSSSSSQNGIFSLRGVYSGNLNFGFDQAVVTNIDGIQLSGGGAGLSTQVDLEQIEILKGPQALFFGKNSTGGIISYNTADPTDEFLVQLRGGYEFEADKKIGEVILSGPLTDTLGARLVLNTTSADGAFENTFLNATDTKGLQDYDEFFGRLTLLFQPADNFSARFKASLSDRDGGHAPTFQRVNCSAAVLAASPGEKCKKDNKVFIPDNPNIGITGINDASNGRYFHEYETTLTSLELNWDITEELSLTSLTGYYEVTRDNRNIGTSSLFYSALTGGALPDNLPFVTRGAFKQDATSQEFRLASNFDSSFNFTLGAFYEEGFRSQYQVFNVDPSQAIQEIDQNTYSTFGEVIVDVSETVEITAGVRWSREEREFNGLALIVDTDPSPAVTALAFDQPMIPADDELSFDNVSPEVTISWHPLDNLMFFAAYKEGFKAGSFDLGPLNIQSLVLDPSTEITFDEETVDGFEVGVKSEWLDSSLRVNAAIYRYEYQDLQLTSFIPTGTPLVTTRVDNVGESLVQGIEAEVLWLPSFVEGLTIQAALNYNDTQIKDYIGKCNQSQRLFGAPGCDLDLDGDTVLDAQNLEGKPLPYAPDWSGSISVSLDRSFTGGSLRYRASISGIYSDDYNAGADALHDPLDEQDSYFLTNISLGLYDENKGWEVDFSARNMGDEHYNTNAGEGPFDAARSLNVARGAQYMLQVTVRPMEFFNN